MPMHPLVALLAAERERRRVPRAAIGRRIGRTPEAIRRWETGLASPRLPEIAAYARVLGLELTLLPAPNRARTTTTQNGTR